MTKALLFAASLVFVGACGSDNKTAADAPKAAIDAPGASPFTKVACPTTADATVVTSGMAYSPAATSISVGQTVRFTMPSSHNVSGTGTATALQVDFGGDTCYQFTGAGTYGFKCTLHGFTGTVTAK